MKQGAKLGLSLPIEMIVIVAVAVLVLVVVSVFFTSSTIGGEIGIRRQQALDSACQNLRSLYNCAPNKLDDVKVSYQELGEDKSDGHTLSAICSKFSLNSNDCYLRCGCSTGAATPAPGATATPAPRATPTPTGTPGGTVIKNP